MKTSAENIKKWLSQSIDDHYYDSRYELMSRAFDPGRNFAFTRASGSTFPDYPDLRAEYKEVGVSSWILQTQITAMSRILRSVPEPEFPEVDEYTGQVRQSFWKARNRSYGKHKADGFVQMQKAWLDGDGLGMGFVQYGLKTDPKTGFRRTVAKHVPLLQMIWDRTARSFCEAGMACSMSYMPFHMAEVLFGKKKARENLYSMQESRTKETLEVVRVFEYYDSGHGNGDPTSAIILGDITNDPEDIEENAFECLPYAHYEHILLPGMRRASGRIDLLVAEQEGLNQIERSMNQEVKRVGFDIMSPDILVETDIEKVEKGNPATVVRMDRRPETGEVVYERIPAGEISNTNLAVFQMRKESFMATAGTSELERGQDIEGADTLGEVQLVDQRSKTQSNWSIFQTARYFQRCVEVFNKVAAVGDDEPVMLDVLGTNVLFNDPADPNMDITGWLEEESEVVVSEETLMKGDLEMERQGQMARLNALMPEVQAGVVDMNAYTEEKIKALGYDPKKFMTKYLMEAQGGGMMDPAMMQQPGMAQQFPPTTAR